MDFDRVGEVIGVLYPGEDEVAVFILGSAEVALCSREEWHGAKARMLDPAPVSDFVGQPDCDHSAGQSLQQLLGTLGVSVT